MWFSIPFFNKRIRGSLSITNEKKVAIDGYCSRTADKLHHVIMLDYDFFRYESLVEELFEIQSHFNISDFYVFESNKGYHALAFDAVHLYEYLQIMKNRQE